MFKVLVNYNFTPDKEWIGDDYLIYERSDDGIDHLKDFDQSKIIRTDNVGNVDYDKLSYLVDYYDELPDVFLWGKSNLFKYTTPEEFAKIKDRKDFTPVLTADHKTYSDNLGVVNYYQNGIYWERNNSWFLNQHYPKYISSWNEWADLFALPKPPYIPFAPGGNYILTKKAVYKYARDFYDEMRSYLPYSREPGEAQCAERSYYLMFK